MSSVFQRGGSIPGCSFSLRVSRLGRYEATATKETRRNGRWQREDDPTSRKNVLLKDWLIVGLGDSNGSGEGTGPFTFPRCNRSKTSYQYKMAKYLEDQDKRTTVSFLHTACSGAVTSDLFRDCLLYTSPSPRDS